MDSCINRRVRELKESATLAVMGKAAQLRAQGRDIVDLSTGEPDIDTPEHIKDAARQALAAGRTKYTPVAGIAPLREALAQKLSRENRIPTEPAAVVVTNGGKQALHEIFDVVLEPGDEVIIPAPYWVSFPAMVQLSGGTPVEVYCGPAQGYKLRPEDLERALTPRTRILIFNSPSNPTGAVYNPDEVRALGEVLQRFPRVIIVADEVYEKVLYGGASFSSFAALLPELAERTVTVNAFSKSYSMTGWRVGYATGPKQLIAAMIRHQSQTTSGVSSVGQYAALAALEGPQGFIQEMVQSFARRIDAFEQRLPEIRGIQLPFRPAGAFFLFLRVEPLLAGHGGRFPSAASLAEFLLEEAGVATVPGEAFGDPAALRVSVGAADQQIDAALTRLNATLAAQG